MVNIGDIESNNFDGWKNAIAKNTKLRASVLRNPSAYYGAAEMTKTEMQGIVILAAMLEIMGGNKEPIISEDTCDFHGVSSGSEFMALLSTDKTMKLFKSSFYNG